MTATLNPYISKFDAGFDVERSSTYRMAIQLALGGYSFAVFDGNDIIAIEAYRSDSFTDWLDVQTAVERTLESKKMLGKPFNSVACIIDDRTSVWVPNALFDLDKAPTYLGFNFPMPNGTTVLHDSIPEADCVNVYGIPQLLINRLTDRWPHLSIKHAGSLFVSTVLEKKHEEDHAYVNVRNRDFDLVIIKDGALAFVNNFRFNTKEDFAYFLLFALEQNHLTGQDLPVTFSGLILPESEIVDLCSRYIKTIDFVEKPEGLKTCEAIKEIPYQYYHLYYPLFR